MLNFSLIGFTGQLVAEYLSKSYPTGLRWAIVGRNEAKLRSLHSKLKLSNSVGILVADAEGSPRICDNTFYKKHHRLTWDIPFHLRSIVSWCCRITDQSDHIDSWSLRNTRWLIASSAQYIIFLKAIYMNSNVVNVILFSRNSRYRRMHSEGHTLLWYHRRGSMDSHSHWSVSRGGVSTVLYLTPTWMLSICLPPKIISFSTDWPPLPPNLFMWNSSLTWISIHQNFELVSRRNWKSLIAVVSTAYLPI